MRESARWRQPETSNRRSLLPLERRARRGNFVTQALGLWMRSCTRSYHHRRIKPLPSKWLQVGRKEDRIPLPLSDHNSLTKPNLTQAIKEACMRKAPGPGSLSLSWKKDGQGIMDNKPQRCRGWVRGEFRGSLPKVEWNEATLKMEPEKLPQIFGTLK